MKKKKKSIIDIFIDNNILYFNDPTVNNSQLGMNKALTNTAIGHFASPRVDPQGSYTGNDKNNEKPVQDADDL